MEQLNINQLQNLWLRSPDERLASWREFRIELQSHYALVVNGNDVDDSIMLSSLESIRKWWEQVPNVSVAIDPYCPKSWPTIWEIIYEGECCKYSRGLAMAYNMHYMDCNKTVTLDRVYDHKNNDEYMIAVFDSKYAMNILYNQVTPLRSVAYLEIRESFDIRSYLRHRHH